MSILVRENKVKYLDTVDCASNIFEFAERSIFWFENFFRTKYPFSKVQFAFLPDYNGGAMENPGIITFSEEFIFESSPSISDITDRGLYIAHELAHMWFGDLVTMKWWDDLWLNESFADFCAYQALHSMKKDFTR